MLPHMKPENRSLEIIRTQLLHLQEEDPHPFVHPHVQPIYQTSTYCFDTVEEACDTFSGRALKDAYSRISSPNHRLVERGLAILENGEAAQVFGSGMGAITALIGAFVKQGEHIIVAEPVYGGTYDALINFWHARYGIECTFINFEGNEEGGDLADVVKPNTRLFFGETPANPTLAVFSIAAISGVLKMIKPDIVVAVDNIFATPFNQRPLELGADIVVQSMTKYLGGKGTCIAGALIGSAKHIAEVSRYYSVLGSVLDARVAWGIGNNLVDFLHTMPIHNKNAFEIARFLDQQRTFVSRVYYPGLERHPGHRIARSQMTALDGGPGFGGMVSFSLHGSLDITRLFLNRLGKLMPRGISPVVSLAVSLGTRDGLIEWPAGMTHASIAREEREAQGISDKLIRYSVGLESADLVKEAFESAFLEVFGARWV